ncbi:MAG: DMT family transporter [Pseudomonadota bacterium]
MTGITLMVFASACFAGMAALVKALGPEFPFVEAMFFRGIISLPILFAILHFRKISFRTPNPGLMAVRGGFGMISMLSAYYSLQRGKLANIIVMGRAQPLFLVLLSPMLLKERASPLALVSLAFGFSGVLLIVKPTAELIDMPALIRLIGAMIGSIAYVAIRRLSATNRPELIVFYFFVITTLLSGVLSIPFFVVPTTSQFLLLLGISLFATAAQLLMTTAFKLEDAPVIATTSYAGVVFGLIVGYIFWKELPDSLALLGAAIIVFSGVILAYSKRPTHASTYEG